MIMALIVVTVFLLILLTGFYVAAEFSTVNVQRTKINQLAEQDDLSSRLLLPILEDSRKLERYVTASQVGITVSSLVLGAFVHGEIVSRLDTALTQRLSISLSPEAADWLGSLAAVVIVLLFVASLQVIFGELFPKALAIQYPERIARTMVWPMYGSLLLFALPIRLFEWATRIILRLAGRDMKDGGRGRSPEEIEILVTESHEGGLLDDNERRLLRNALRLRDLTARQVMVHRTRIAAAPLDTSALELMQMAIDAGYSRIPLYRDSIDEIAGFVHVKDVFRLFNQGESDVAGVVRDVVYVPETLPINDVWDQLDLQNRYLAIVFDEFGGTAGLLTLEDLIEEVFGELQDEFDDEAAVIARDKEGRIYLRGDLLVSDVNEYLELDLPEEAADTLSGLVFSLLGRPPVEGDELLLADVVIRVETMEDLGVGELSLQPPPSESDDHFSEWDIADHE